MLEVKITDIAGFEQAIKGMRNPLNSWGKMDSYFMGDDGVSIGEKDLDLMRRLYQAGPEHRKYMRMIEVWMDITAPLYWWKEFDTYKIGTIANSCSTMHKIADKEFGFDDFSCEHMNDVYECPVVELGEQRVVMNSRDALSIDIQVLNFYRALYNQTKDKNYWWQLIQHLPSSYNQKRTVMVNYEVCDRIIWQRENHKLDEWHVLCEALLELPYMRKIREK